MDSSPASTVTAGRSYTDAVFDKWEATKLTKAEFGSCKIRNCHSQRIDLSGTVFEDCTFINCDFSNATISGTRFVDCTFNSCKLLGWNWAKAGIPLRIALTGCNCTEGNFFGVRLKKATLTKNNFTNADFGDTDFSYSNLSGSDFSGARFLNAKLMHTDFSEGIFAGTRFLNANLSFADFRRAAAYAIDIRCNIVRQAHFSLPDAVGLLCGLDIVVE